VKEPFLKLFPEVLDHIERVQGLQEHLQDGNTGRHLLPGRDREKPKPVRRGTPPAAPTDSAAPAPALKEGGEGDGVAAGTPALRGKGRGEAAGPAQASKAGSGPQGRAAAHRSLTLRRAKSAPRWSSLRRARRAAGGTACTASRRARSSSGGKSRRAARSSSSTTASAILTPPQRFARARRP